MATDSDVTTASIAPLLDKARADASRPNPVPAEDAPVVQQRELNDARGRELARRNWGKQ